MSMTKSMIKVLWLASWYPNATAPFDGDFIQRHARALALIQPVHVVFVVKEREQTGNARVRVEDSTTGHLRETILYYRPRTTGWRIPDRLLSWWTYNQVFHRFLQDDIRQNGLPSLVHVHVAMRAGMVARWLKTRYGVPYLLTEHWTGYSPASDDNYYERNFFFRHATRKILQHATRLLPVSRDLGEAMSRIHPRPFTVVPNVADTALFYYREPEAAPFRFIHASSMNHQKNVPGLLRAFVRLTALHAGTWTCSMIGPAPEELVEACGKMGLKDRINWKGEIPYHEVAAEMQQAHAFVLFSRFENLPCVLIEAACCGLPVIAPRLAGIPEIVDGSNGLLVEPGDEAGMAGAMATMISNYSQYNRKKISERATALFNYERIGKMMAEVYRTLL